MTLSRNDTRFHNGLAMLQAASVALGDTSDTAVTPPIIASTATPAPASMNQNGTCTFSATSVRALLNPAPFVPEETAPSDPCPQVLGKDGKVKKKRGRKPTPGLTEEDRRQARLLKNRRTAEMSRKRKVALLNTLTEERDEYKRISRSLQSCNDYLINRLASALGISTDSLIKDDPNIAKSQSVISTSVSSTLSPPQSDISSPSSVVDSDDDRSIAHLTCTDKMPHANV